MDERKSLYDRLRENNLSFVWLISMLNAKGIRCDKAEMSSTVKGALTGNKADLIIEKSHAALDQYEVFYRSVKL